MLPDRNPLIFAPLSGAKLRVFPYRDYFPVILELIVKQLEKIYIYIYLNLLKLYIVYLYVQRIFLLCITA